MELIHAKEAYANTLLAQRHTRRLMFEKLAMFFNKCINDASACCKTTCIIRWRDFDVNEEIATDEEATAELLENVVTAGYEVEFCYNSPSAYNPCGIVVAWGNNAEEELKEAFESVEGNLWRGE